MAVHGAVAETCARCFLEDSSSGTASLEHNEVKAGLNSLSFILWSNLQNLGKLCPMSSPGLCLTDITSAIVVGSSRDDSSALAAR